MTILEKIFAYKQEEVAGSKRIRTAQELKDSEFFGRMCYSLEDSIKDSTKNGIIAEFKRASPSRGLINGHSTVADVVQSYQLAGASAVSVLTDGPSFQGSLDDLLSARSVLSIPLLRKEFIVDSYQILEAKAYGADIILLIAAMLPSERIQELAAFAHQLGLSVLLEVHNLKELQENLWPGIDAIGVNNRNLHDFSVSIEHSLNLVDHIPSSLVKISESGISDPKTIRTLKSAGFEGFLIGEKFMNSPNPGLAITEFAKSV